METKYLLEHFIKGQKLYHKMMLPVMEKYDLTYMEFSIIMFLNNNKGYDTAKDIVNHRLLTKSHVSSAIKSLINKNYIKTFSLDGNKKTIHLKLDPSLNDMIKDGLKAQRNFKNIVNANLSEQELKTLKDLFMKIDENLDRNL